MSCHCCGNARAGRLISLCNNSFCMSSSSEGDILTSGGTTTTTNSSFIGRGLGMNSVICHSFSNCIVSRKMFTRNRCGESGLDTFVSNSISGANC